MTEEKDTQAIERIQKAIDCLKSNDFTLFFFTVDCKNTPNGSVAYIYQMAKTLHDNGYNVKMLYQLENEYTQNELYQLKKKDKPLNYSRVFQGVGDWLGEEYANLPHLNIATEEFKVSPSDFLFIPEAFASLMFQTYKYKAPCKRIVILQNYDYTMDFIPYGQEWKNYGIHEVIATSETQASLIKRVFPYTQCHIINPCISECFRKPLTAKNLVVNLVTKRQEDVNRIIKPFFWLYPMLKFVTFRDLRGFPREKFAEMLQEGAITVWVDEDTPFGYSALEAMKCGNLVIGKVPNIVPEWMKDENGDIANNGFWTYDINTIPDVIAKVVTSWMQGNIPQVLVEQMDKTNSMYTEKKWTESVLTTFTKLVEERSKTFEEIRNEIKNNGNKTAE